MRAVLCRAAVVCLATMTVLGPVARSAGQAAEEFPWLATLTVDDVARPGSDARYYPFARLKAGDVVKVVGTKDGWARVVTAGPAFHRTIGIVRHPRSGQARLRLSSDGRAGVTLTTLDVHAPNLDSKDVLEGSWKPVIELAAGRTVSIVEMTSTAQDVVYSIAMPTDAEGFIDPASLRPATDSEKASFEAALGDRPAIEPGRLTRTDAPGPPSETAVVAPLPQEPAGRALLNEGATLRTGAESTEPAAIDAADAESAPEQAPLATAQPVRRPVSPEQRRARIMLEDLEVAYARLQKEPIETAEVEPLRLLYLDLAGRQQPGQAVARFARTRARQLELWAEVQRQRSEMTVSVQRARRTSAQADEARRIIESHDRYVVVGRLDVSTIYDGKRLPRLLRVQDPATGRTRAYIEPDTRFDYASLLGRRIGVVGTKAEDEGLRVTLIEPRRIDVLGNDVEGPTAPQPVQEAVGPTG